MHFAFYTHWRLLYYTYVDYRNEYNGFGNEINFRLDKCYTWDHYDYLWSVGLSQTVIHNG